MHAGRKKTKSDFGGANFSISSDIEPSQIELTFFHQERKGNYYCKSASIKQISVTMDKLNIVQISFALSIN